MDDYLSSSMFVLFSNYIMTDVTKHPDNLFSGGLSSQVISWKTKSVPYECVGLGLDPIVLVLFSVPDVRSSFLVSKHKIQNSGLVGS